MKSPRIRRVRLGLLGALLLVSGLTASRVEARSMVAPLDRAEAPPLFQSCASGAFCHVGMINDPAGMVMLGLVDMATGMPFTEYAPGQSYVLTFSINSGRGDRMRWGIQALTLIDATMGMAGSFGPVGLGCNPGYTVQDDAANARQSISHAPAPFGGAGATWDVCWDAPATDLGPLTFYVCGNAANGVGATGDFIQCETFSVMPGGGPADSDGDGLTDAEEMNFGTDPFDQDTDDDGISDFDEIMSTGSSALACDTDGDGLPDGLEVGVDTPLADTDLGAGCFEADLDTMTTTNPDNPDSDGDGCSDGVEDANTNGLVDGGETDPNDGNDCPPAPTSHLRVAWTASVPMEPASLVFATMPCTTLDDIRICSEAVGTVDDFPGATLPMDLSGAGRLVFIDYDSDTGAAATGDVILVEKNLAMPGTFTVREQ